ncbi:hypothetical protein B0H10DRAFT_1947914 [Mycena sp. CBHHK59/15]|nr:hypothetical protein B0H10DRAFT_1947914 [Mycena sp. CBHHK59/15]
MPKTNSLSNELLLIIFELVLESSSPEQPFSYSRLDAIRRLTGVCKSWGDPSRAVFWSKVDVAHTKMPEFAAAMLHPHAKLSCIREITFRCKYDRDTDALHVLRHHGDIEGADELQAVQDERTAAAASAIPVILDHLPRNSLQIFTFTYEYLSMGFPIFQAMERYSVSNPDKKIAVRQLVIPKRPHSRNLQPFLSNFRDLQSLHLDTNCFDLPDFTFPSPLIASQLHHLAITVDFEGGFRDLSESLTSLAQALAPSCSSLQSLGLFFDDWHDVEAEQYISSFRILQPLGASTIRTLELGAHCDEASCDTHNMDDELAGADAFCPYPLLETIRLSELGISGAGLRRMHMVSLRRLEIAVNPVGGERARELLEALQSTDHPLSNIEALDVQFCQSDFEKKMLFDGKWWPRSGTEEEWAPVEEYCAAQGISCAVHHRPESTPVQREVNK